MVIELNKSWVVKKGVSNTSTEYQSRMVQQQDKVTHNISVGDSK
jgi:hypothetical protein